MASPHRDAKIIAAVPCPECGARMGEPCRNPIAHQPARGPQDRRPQPLRPHNPRRLAWVESKHATCVEEYTKSSIDVTIKIEHYKDVSSEGSKRQWHSPQ